MKRFLSLTTLIILVCSCTSRKNCATTGDEPVSVCRAEAKCKSAGKSLGMISSGAGAAASGQENLAQAQYESCIDRDLAAQKSKAGFIDNSQKCVSRKTSANTVETTCR